VNEDCLKLTTYFGERDRTPDGLLGDELMAIYGEQRLQASVLLRGVEGFGRLNHLHTDRLLSLSEDLPVSVVVVDSRDRIEAFLPQLEELVTEGLVMLDEVWVVRHVGRRSAE
jgi:PII-like signaling protein